jgi:arylsulfatase A-like enzyme
VQQSEVTPGREDASISASSDGGRAADASEHAVTGAHASSRASIVFVLTDDLSWNLVSHMPAVLQLQNDGVTFSRYFVTDSLCCPSRSSIFTGKFPHDTHVFTNSGKNGGYATFERYGNEKETFAAALRGADYKTSMMGKYLNGYDPVANGADPGWLDWNVAGNGYPEFDYLLNRNGEVRHYGDSARDYMVDVLSRIANEFVEGVGDDPFLIEIATFAPHAPYTPAPRYVGTSHDIVPRIPSYDRRNVDPPKWLAEQPALSADQLATLDRDFNLRVEAVQAVDDLITSIRRTLAASALGKSTYIVFSSDNGYHMGEHMLRAGKQTAFDEDIRVPLIVVGPGVPAGVVVDRIVENIDLCPTFAELAGVPAPKAADGRSLAALIHGRDVPEWRSVALVEHRGPDLEPSDPADPDKENVSPSEPNSYEALRMASSVYVSYFDGEEEYYDHETDPFEMTNTIGSLDEDQRAELRRRMHALATCHGSDDCWKAQQ